MNVIVEQDDALLYLQSMLAENPKPAGRKILGEQLAAATNRACPYTPAYLANVARERQPMSNKLAKAVYMLKLSRLAEWKNAEK